MQPVSKRHAVTLNKQLVLRNLKYNWLLSDTQYWSLVKTIVPQNMYSILHKRTAFSLCTLLSTIQSCVSFKRPPLTSRKYEQDLQQGAKKYDLTHILSCRRKPIRSRGQFPAGFWLDQNQKGSHFWAPCCKYPCVICLSMKTFCTQSTEILTFVSINCIKLIRWVWCLIRPQLLA